VRSLCLSVVLLSACSRCQESAPAQEASTSDVTSEEPAAPDVTTKPPCGIFLLDEHTDIYVLEPKPRMILRLSHASCDFGTDLGPRTMAFKDGWLWAATYEGRVVKIDPADGKCERTSHFGSPARLDLAVFQGDFVVADDTGLRRLEREDPLTFLMKTNVTLVAGEKDLYGERGNAIVRIDLTKKKIEQVVAIEQPAPLAVWDGVLYLFQGSEGLTHGGETAGALRYDPKTKNLGARASRREPHVRQRRWRPVCSATCCSVRRGGA